MCLIIISGDEMRVLIIEDEFKLADLISTRLKKEKYLVDISLNGEEGLDNALTNIYDLIILDVMLPKVNGFEVLKKLKDNEIKSKVIMLTAKSELEDKLTGLTNGAIDYVTKPFHMEELVARVNAHLRNDINTSNDYLEFGDLRLNVKTLILSCTKTNEEIEISMKEYMLLEYLINNSSQIVSKDQIYDKIWGVDNEIESNNLEVYISFIRKKIKAIGSKVNIKAVRNMGYKLEVCDGKIKD